MVLRRFLLPFGVSLVFLGLSGSRYLLCVFVVRCAVIRGFFWVCGNCFQNFHFKWLLLRASAQHLLYLMFYLGMRLVFFFLCLCCPLN